jgi:hypothetical protein
MALDKLLLEDGSGGYELEDASGRVLLDPVGPSITATLSLTEAADTVTASATVATHAALSATEASDSRTITAAVGIAASAALTEASDSITSSAAARIAASLTKSQAAHTISATGTIATHGALTCTEAADTIAASGTVAIVGSLTRIEAADTVSASGYVRSPITATVSVTESDDTISAAAAVAINCELDVTEDSETVVVQYVPVPVYLPAAQPTLHREPYQPEPPPRVPLPERVATLHVRLADARCTAHAITSWDDWNQQAERLLRLLLMDEAA